MAVDRCVCHDVPFRELVRLNREDGLDLEQLMDRTGCCTGCTSCEPYVKIALATGEIDLPVMNGRELHERFGMRSPGLVRLTPEPASATLSRMSGTPESPSSGLTIADLQRLIRERYHDTDSARGTPGTFMWLMEEIGELATSLHECAPDQSPTPEQLAANLEEEFADVLAWLVTLANINGVDLNKALTKYTEPGRVEGVKH